MSDILEDFLEAKLQDEFIRTDEEWVNIYITPLNRIDLTIVSNIADEMDKSELRGYIRNLVFEYLGVDEGSRYSIGFLDTYNTDEADDLLLQKPEYRRKQPITWSEVVSMNNYIRSKISSRNYSVICFYSYKGGVGRTTALLQVAYTLAAQGKNIVLIDFDIEAPSFHLLFKKWIDDPKYGIKYGLVDYLYERMASVDPEEYKIKITDVFTTIKVNETLNGNIYVVPATVKLTNQYIFKLAQLHSNIIFENEYVEEFIDALASRLKFNTVFIDTRTGINQWGAFPLLGFADQIVLVAYPNEENVEGLTNIIELMQKVGLDNYVVAMSKFEDDDKGINIAKEYFDKLKDIKQEFLGIGYMSSADMIGKYPFLDNLEPYKALSDYISESEIVKFNVKFLSKVNVVEILKHIKRCFSNAEDIIKDETLKTDISLLKKGEQEAELTEEGIRKLVMELLDSSIFNEYIDAILESKDIFKCLSNVNGSSGSSGSTQTEDIKEGVNENLPARECVIRQKILDLFWGIRVSPKRYCKPVSFWFYNELKNICESTKVKTSQNNTCTVNKSMVIKILNKALEMEIDKRIKSKEGVKVKGAKSTNFAEIHSDAVNDRLL
ncbi:MAG: AAA family ATPase, partial [Clostridiaceae bacterium]|nr:AAA family ATPase [Clostridiaceae bacterium]